MSHQYQAIAWNRQKRVYDLVLAAGVTLYLTLFIGVSAFLFPYATAKTLIIRAAGSAAFLLLHIVLCIGPLCRLDTKFSTAWPQSDSSTVSVIRTRSSVC
jgi:sulfoxide reductase heme-binding subunit YedZ